MAESAELWTVAQIAVHIGKPWRRAYDLLLSGRFGPAERRGRTWLGRAEMVRAYVEQRAGRHV